MKVYVGCFGSGLGHASRMLEVAQELTERGAQVELSSSGEVTTLIRSKGYTCNDLPLADVRYSEGGEFSLRLTMAASASILARTYLQVAMELSNIGHFGPDVVLSDSALSTVLAAKLLGLPTFTVLNQLNLTSSHGDEAPLSRILSVGISAGTGKLWELSDEVLLPDLPPPYTISERNLWGSNVEKTRYVGFLTPGERSKADEAASDFSSSHRPRVFWQVSGPPLTRTAFLKLALDVAKALSEEYTFVVSGGSPGTSATASRIPGGWYYGWCGIAEFYFRACDLVVARAGHGTIGQTLSSSKPSLLIPIPRQPEQEGNAEKAVKLGVSLRLTQEQATVDRIREGFKTLLEGDFSERAKMLGEVALRFDARRELVRTLETAATRARPAPR